MTNMSGAITVHMGSGSGDTMDALAFFKNVGTAQAAMANLRASSRSFASSIASAGKAFVRMGRAADGVLAALMQTSTVAAGLEKGVSNLYKWSKAYLRTLSSELDSLATDALYLKNSLAAMASPLIRQLAPELEPDFARYGRLEVYDEKMKIFM